MSQPPGFVNSAYPNHVCKLTKALYGLKQSPRAWYTKLYTCLLSWGFLCSQSETFLFSLHTGSQLTLILVYVNDIIITGTHASLVNTFITKLNYQFALKDLGTLSYFLGIQVSIHSDCIHLSQQKIHQRSSSMSLHA